MYVKNCMIIIIKVSEGRFGNPILELDEEYMEEGMSNKARLACDILKRYK